VRPGANLSTDDGSRLRRRSLFCRTRGGAHNQSVHTRRNDLSHFERKHNGTKKVEKFSFKIRRKKIGTFSSDDEEKKGTIFYAKNA
jgi:hypothetical protein